MCLGIGVFGFLSFCVYNVSVGMKDLLIMCVCDLWVKRNMKLCVRV